MLADASTGAPAEACLGVMPASLLVAELSAHLLGWVMSSL